MWVGFCINERVKCLILETGMRWNYVLCDASISSIYEDIKGDSEYNNRSSPSLFVCC